MEGSFVTWEGFYKEMEAARLERNSQITEVWKAIDRTTGDVQKLVTSNALLTEQLRASRKEHEIERQRRRTLSNRWFLLALALFTALVGVSLQEIVNGIHALLGLMVFG